MRGNKLTEYRNGDIVEIIGDADDLYYPWKESHIGMHYEVVGASQYHVVLKWTSPIYGDEHPMTINRENVKLVYRKDDMIPSDSATTDECDFGESCSYCEDDPVSPNHYAKYTVQPIEAIRDWGLNFDAGNVVKYVVRHRDKNGLEDLLKARRYLDSLIESFDN